MSWRSGAAGGWSLAAPVDSPKKHLRSDPVDNQRGEVEWDGGNLYFTDWDYEVTVEPVGAR